MRAIVTGGAGFIGSHVVDAVIDDGGEVLVVDDLRSGRLANLDRASPHLVQVDIRDGDALTATFVDFRPEVVFHLAAQIDVRASMADPAHDASINVLGSVNVFAAAAAAGARRVVNTSTGGAIYGECSQIPTPETVTPRPSSAYGLSKWAAEQYGDWFGRARGLDVVTLRYGNVYGPRQDPKGDAGVIAVFGDQVLTGGTPTIYGDGTQTRDFVYVGDIAAANLAAATATELPHRQYNIGSGVEVSVRELVDAHRTGRRKQRRSPPVRRGPSGRGAPQLPRRQPRSGRARAAGGDAPRRRPRRDPALAAARRPRRRRQKSEIACICRPTSALFPSTAMRSWSVGPRTEGRAAPPTPLTGLKAGSAPDHAPQETGSARGHVVVEQLDTAGAAALVGFGHRGRHDGLAAQRGEAAGPGGRYQVVLAHLVRLRTDGAGHRHRHHRSH